MISKRGMVMIKNAKVMTRRKSTMMIRKKNKC